MRSRKRAVELSLDQLENARGGDGDTLEGARVTPSHRHLNLFRERALNGLGTDFGEWRRESGEDYRRTCTLDVTANDLEDGKLPKSLYDKLQECLKWTRE